MTMFRATMILLAVTGPALAATEPPAAVCGQARVLEAVRQRLARAGQPVVIEAADVGQVPGGRAGTVNCAVRLHTAIYDTPRLGPVPADVVEVYRYSLELRRNGVFLLP